MATTEMAITTMDAAALEQVLVSGDLSKLTSPQRVQYYQRVCQSIGLNPLTKPFDYITLNGKLTLYAKKDATDQLRSIKSVSIDDVDLQESGDNFIVKVKGHDITGRSDVEIGIVKKSDMQGNAANAQMKAVTKAKRRLTLSLCGLGWLDETEVETIPSAKPISVHTETGEIINGELAYSGAPDDIDANFPPVTQSQPAQNSNVADIERKGNVTPQMLVELKLSEDIASASGVLTKMKLAGKTAAYALPFIRRYRALRDSGKTSAEAAVEAFE